MRPLQKRSFWGTARKPQMSGEHTPRPSGARRSSKIYKEKLLALQERYGYKPHTVQEYDELTQQIRKEMANTNVQVSRADFNHWLSTERELLETLNDAEIDLSCKSDLFDVLDADLSGVLEFEEMPLGGPKPSVSEDIIAIRLKTSHLVQLVTRLCAKLDVPTGDPFAEDEC
ncbi:Pentatricopeptide repeat-containing protein [Durusdinium trenchii]|uniref:Chloroplastic n=1 Tax=Durusdinium trenchii TaxID=1381693 RepID=A0ABP0QWG8_9DINO